MDPLSNLQTKNSNCTNLIYILHLYLSTHAICYVLYRACSLPFQFVSSYQVRKPFATIHFLQRRSIFPEPLKPYQYLHFIKLIHQDFACHSRSSMFRLGGGGCCSSILQNKSLCDICRSRPGIFKHQICLPHVSLMSIPACFRVGILHVWVTN